MTEIPRCSICGEPMPEDQRMFKFHGADGNGCPKPPLVKRTLVVAEYALRESREGEFWIEVTVDRRPHDKIGPFETEAQCQRAYDDLMSMMRSVGATDLPAKPQ